MFRYKLKKSPERDCFITVILDPGEEKIRLILLEWLEKKRMILLTDKT